MPSAATFSPAAAWSAAAVTNTTASRRRRCSHGGTPRDARHIMAPLCIVPAESPRAGTSADVTDRLPTEDGGADAGGSQTGTFPATQLTQWPLTCPAACSSHWTPSISLSLSLSLSLSPFLSFFSSRDHLSAPISCQSCALAHFPRGHRWRVGTARYSRPARRQPPRHDLLC